MENLKDLNKELKRSAKKSSVSFLNTYLDNEETILKLLKSFKGTKSEIYLKEVNSELKNFVRFSTLFSDITTVNTAPSGVNDTQISYFSPGNKYYRERELTIPGQYVPEIGTDPKRLLPCYYHRNDHEIRKLFQELKPMLECERLLVRPLRGLYVGFPEIQSGNLYYVDPNTSNDHWYVNVKEKDEFITIDNGLTLKYLTKLFEMTLPFFTEIDLAVLSKILDDESDLLSSFRIELKNTIRESSNEIKTVDELIQDVLKPKIDKIGKRFMKIQGRHRLGVGVAVGSFALTLTIATLQGKNLFDALAAAGFAGSIGAILLSNADYNDKISDFKDDPYYLLWQIKRLS